MRRRKMRLCRGWDSLASGEAVARDMSVGHFGHSLASMYGRGYPSFTRYTDCF